MLQAKGCYLYRDGEPFFWLGDTAWLLCENLSEADIDRYLKNRSDLGFNVVQTVLFYTLPGTGDVVNRMSTGGKDIFSEDYFALVERVLDKAEALGMYIALLPCWGSYVKEGVLRADDAPRFAEFLTRRFGGHENLIWVLGGDVKGDADPALFHALGTELKRRDSRHLVTFHPFGRTLSARWFHAAPWCDFHMFQSGHRRYDQMRLNAWDDQPELWYGEDNWRYVEEALALPDAKPCLDGEPSYEDILQGLHDPAQPYWQAADVRRYAYWSVFAGACGFTYGHNAVMQFYQPNGTPGSYGVRQSWQQALNAPGAAQLRFLKELMERADFTRGHGANHRLRSPQGQRYHRVSVLETPRYLLAYTFLGDSFSLDLAGFADRGAEAFWLDPETGARTFLGDCTGQQEVAFHPPRRAGDANDWVLAVRSKPRPCVRKAVAEDIGAVGAIYARVHDSEEQGRSTIGWVRGVYPTQATAQAALDRGELFVMEEDGAVVAAAILNQTQVPEYALCPWRYAAPAEEVMVLHTLVVDPAAGGRGYGRAFVAFYESYALDHGCRYLRMDTNARNTRARKLYAQLGYAEPGIVPCVFNGISGVQLVCLEKRL